ncbi:hypothetical protein AVEN_179912-1 [Araneus ventricosus]|uniref:Structure-specific endonuclease subunit SLX4 n=1 Tax=Araneus ventricosus TaxID=182803 RepID=A0A4Y2LCX8_ARAVE|nr:hypothetical protein AVEN_179912-1 [Araneus ventricosus]
MKRKTENGNGTHQTSQKALQAEKENLFLKYLHAPLSSSYKGYPSETRSIPPEMKDISNKVELEKMSTQGEIHKEYAKNSLCLEKATAAKKVLCDSKNKLDETLDDFQESQIEKKQKLKKRREIAIFACVVCQSDITHLDFNERAIHVNQCIDGQSSTVIPTQETTAENAFILDCPLCFKHFPTSEVRSAHIKKCGKSRGLSTQSVIQALRLQEKHVLERRALGLPLNNKPAKQPKKPAAKKFLIKPKSAMESDIHLAKALSLSLKENENKTPTNFDSADPEDSQSTAILQAPSEFQNPGKFVSKKKTLKPTSFLLLRSEEERQKIILEKVNSVIASLSEFKSDVSEDVKHDSTEQKRAFLWNMCGKAEDKKAYYVEQLLDWISPSDVEVGSKLCNLSQIAGHRIFTQLPCDYTFSSADKIDENSVVHEDIESPSLIKSLRSLIGNCWMSDVDIHTASGIVIPAHKLFLALRCPSLKNAFDEPVPSGRHVLHWENTSFDAALHFLNFIYTGSAEWKEDIIDELHQLAVKYEVHDLLNILDSNKETLEMLICEDGKENTEDSLMDTEVPSEGNSRDTEPPAEQKHDLNENNKDPETESQNANDGYFKDTSNETACANSDNLRNLVSDQDDIVCIQHNTGVAKEIMGIENISSERDYVDEDICILNKQTASYANTNYQTYNLNVETFDRDSISSNDSCQILKARLSSESKTYFDTFQEDVINIVCSEMPRTSEGSIYCTSTYTTPSKTLTKNTNPPFEKFIHSGNVLSPKISPYAPHKSMSNECVSPEMFPCYSGRNTISPRNSLPSFSKAEFKVGSSVKKSSSSPNFRNEKFNEAVVILENEHNKSGKRETNPSSFLKESCSVGSPENRIFSPRKVSPWKVSKLKSPSFNDFDAVPGSQNLFVQNKSVNFERDLDVQRPFLKGCSVSPDVSRFPNSREIMLNCYALSPKARPEMSNYDKDKSFKRNLECSLNDDVYPMNSPSSPEILVCDSDNELEPVVEKSSSSKTQRDWDKDCSSNHEVEAVLCAENYESKDSVFTSNFRESSSSSIKEKTVMPEIICCNSDDDDDADVTIELQSTHKRKDINFDKISELNEPKFIQCDVFSDENECTSVRTNTNNPVLDVIDCCSNSNDDADAIERLQSSSQAKETTIEDEDEYIPLSQRIEAAKSKNNSCKAFEDLVPSSPESPWTFQTDKHCGARPLEKDQNMLKSSASTSKQSYDSTPKHLPKKGKIKNSVAGNQTERGNSVMALNALQPKFKISDSPVTPLPDYKSMVTPDLKQALKRVGVKPLPRKKAVAVLSHIYNETHPWNDGKTEERLESQTQSSPKSTNHTKNLSLPKKRKQINDTSDQPSKKTVKSQPKTTTRANEAATKINSKPKNSSNTNQSSSSGQMYPSETKTSSPDISSSPDGSNNSRENFYNLSSDFSDSSQPDSKENITNVTQYILSNDELYKKVLTYSPLNLMEFQHELKENGISIGVKKLMDYLDEQCITFTCPRKEEYKKKQQARTQRFRKRMIAKMSQQKS